MSHGRFRSVADLDFGIYHRIHRIPMDVLQSDQEKSYAKKKGSLEAWRDISQEESKRFPDSRTTSGEWLPVRSWELHSKNPSVTSLSFSNRPALHGERSQMHLDVEVTNAVERRTREPQLMGWLNKGESHSGFEL